MMNALHRRLPVILLAVGIALAPASMAQSDKQRLAPEQPSAPQRAAVAQPSADRKFVQDAAIGGLEEMELGRLAMQKAASDQVRRLGQRMADDHLQTSVVLMALAEAKGLTLPTSLDVRQQKEIERLQKLSGADFDRAYMKLVVEDHQNDIREFRKQAQRGQDADIKSFAATTLPKLHDHLAMARDAVRTAKFTDPVRKQPATAAAPPDGGRTTGTEDSAAARVQSR